MDIRPIRTDADHAEALKEIERLWGSAPGTDEGDHLDILATLVNAYEDRRWPIAELDPVDAIKAVMAFDNRSQADLASLIGLSRASEVLNRKRPLTLAMIRRLNRDWRVPAELLVKPYEVAA